MLDDTQQQSLTTRLNRVEETRGIRRMVQEPRICLDILQQLAAAEAALNRISLAVLKHHVEVCVPDGIAAGEPERSRRLAESSSTSSTASRSNPSPAFCVPPFVTVVSSLVGEFMPDNMCPG